MVNAERLPRPLFLVFFYLFNAERMHTFRIVQVV
jgi:hypothetical protein